jgi:hypothetical protein
MSFSDGWTDGAFLAEHMKQGFLDRFGYSSGSVSFSVEITERAGRHGSHGPLA